MVKITDVSFRDALITDLPTIVRIYNSTVASRMVTADTEEVSVESRRAWFAGHQPGSRPLWIIETVDKATIGWVSFESFYGRPAYNHTAEISIYLSGLYRGLGLGSSILEYCINKAPSLGIKILLAFIFSHNEASLKLFQKKGFVEWGNLPEIGEIDARLVTLKILGRVL